MQCRVFTSTNNIRKPCRVASDYRPRWMAIFTGKEVYGLIARGPLPIGADLLGRPFCCRHIGIATRTGYVWLDEHHDVSKRQTGYHNRQQVSATESDNLIPLLRKLTNTPYGPGRKHYRRLNPISLFGECHMVAYQYLKPNHHKACSEHGDNCSLRLREQPFTNPIGYDRKGYKDYRYHSHLPRSLI